MNKEEQRIAIAEACGWTEFERKNPMFFGLTGIKPCSDRQVVPDYLNDLNAMHEAVNSLRKKDGPEWFDFQKHLMDECGSTMNCIQASAVQRAEAFLKTLDLWKETQ